MTDQRGPRPLSRLMAGAMALGLGVALAPAAALAETSVERAARTRELSLGVYGNIPPYVQSTAGGGLEGYAIDVAGLIAEEVADYLGVPVKVVSEESEDSEKLFRQVHYGAIDLMCGAQFTWERQMFVDFSVPFALSGIRLLTRTEAIDGTAASLVGKRIGVIGGSLGEATVKALQPSARITPVATFAAGIEALRAGRLDAIAGDSILLGSAADGAGFSDAALVPTVAYNRYAVGCITPENNSTLRNLVNLAIAKMIQGYINEEPRYRTLVNRWLGPESTVGLPEEAITLYFQSVMLNYEQIGVPTSP